MNFDLKKFLKNIKLNEESISMGLGALVIVIVAVLIVNYFKDNKGEITSGDNTENNSGEHVVVKGETLWSIAENEFGSGYNWTDIKEANKLTSETIEVGQKLVIPTVSAKQPTSTKEAQVVEVAGAISGEAYTVVKGDCLWDIAVRSYGDGYKWVEIAKTNKLINPNLIHPGNVLTLPR